MDKKVYIIQGSSGCYEDTYQWMECGYLDEQLAINECERLNEDLELWKTTNDNNWNACNEKGDYCDECCSTCKFDYDYSLDDQHDFRVVECELR